MKFIFLLLPLIVSNIVFAQSDTSFQLLWYQGKKINANTLLTINGDTVRYDPVKSKVKVTSSIGTGKQMDNMLEELGKTRQRRQQMLEELSYLPKPILPQISLEIQQAFADAEENYRKLLSNVITIPNIKLPGIVRTGGKGAAFDLMEWEEPWDVLIQEFRDYITNHSQDTYANLPEPPRFDFRYCARCDTAKQQVYKNQMAGFIEALMGKDELVIMEKAWAASSEAQRFDTEKAKLLQKEVRNLLNFITQRARAKVNKIIYQYIDDPERALAVMDVAVSTEREQQIMGFGTLLTDYAARAFQAYAKRIEQAIEEKDYTIALNHDLVFFVERRTQIYNRKIQGLLEKVMKFNLFKMNMNISAKVSGDGNYMLAAAEGDNWLMTSVDTKNCRLKWYLAGPKLDKLKMTLTAAELQGEGGKATYVGSKDWFADAPAFKLDFCREEGQDSVIAYPFLVEGFNEYWNFPQLGTMNVSMTNTVLGGCFFDLERISQEVAEFKNNPEKIEKLKRQMLSEYKQFSKTSKSVSGIPNNSLDMGYLNSMANTMANGRNISELVHSVNPGRYIFTPELHNKDKVIVKDKLDGKNIFPQNTATEYALFYLTIENDAGGKYSWHNR